MVKMSEELSVFFYRTEEDYPEDEGEKFLRNVTDILTQFCAQKTMFLLYL
jgi:hypothetical protein